MAELAESNPDYLGSSLGLWDPLGCLSLSFWTLGNEATIGYLRHAEIKHGRVAMAAFLGYLAQSTPIVSGPHYKLPFKGYTPGLTPPEQWDAIPLVGKLQIFGLIGMLESYGEILDVHYTQGGMPGYYPPLKGNRPELWFNLYDPFNWFDKEKDKVFGRQCEINNGRLAMFGILGCLSESKVPGSVPLLTGLIPEYSGNYMAPFGADFSLFAQ
ncbi:putative plastid light harvesting protein [Pelagophyceae sp. CCMP2097]|nr:putative plastid light harvesting protein [Pelagophyceae sp. CCMP2097]